jgi:hypothetical protein
MTQVWRENAALLRDATIRTLDHTLKAQSTTALLLPREQRSGPAKEDLQEFVDTALKDIAGKITAKKQVTMDVASLRIAVAEAQKQKQQQETVVKTLKKEAQIAAEADAKTAQAIIELEDLLGVENRKKDTIQHEMQERVNALRSRYERVQTSIQQKKVQLARLQKTTHDEQLKLSQEQERTTDAHANADETLAQLKRAMSESRVSEQARMKLLRQKARVLHSLIAREGVPFASDKLTKEISTILKFSTSSPAVPAHSARPVTSHK